MKSGSALTRRTRLLPYLALAVAAVLAAGCAAPPPSTPTTTPQQPPTGTTTTANTTGPAADATSSPASSAPPQDVTLHVGSYYFTPSSNRIGNGTLTKWVLDSGSHTLRIHREGDAPGQYVFNAEPLPSGGAEYRFNRTGGYAVSCKYHSSMSATISVF